MIQKLVETDLLKNQHLQNALWATIEKIGSKQKQREHLEQGATHSVDLKFSGEVDGHPFLENITAAISIGRDYEKSTSATPELVKLVGYILSKLNQNTRDYLVRTIPQEFQDNGQMLPDIGQDFEALSQQLLSRLRAAKKVWSRGPLRCNYRIHS